MTQRTDEEAEPVNTTDALVKGSVHLLPTTSGDEELVKNCINAFGTQYSDQLDIYLFEGMREWFKHSLKQVITTKNQQIAAASACKVCGGTDVVCAKGVEGQIAAAKAEERAWIEQAHMAGYQSCCGKDASYSEARNYYDTLTNQ